MSARSSLSFLSATIGAVLLAAGGSPAFAQNLSEVAVNGGAPTQIAISLAGKSATVVRQEVVVAARTVCRNAVSNRDLDFTEGLWCRQKSAAKAMRRYEAILAAGAHTAAGPGIIVLSSR